MAPVDATVHVPAFWKLPTVPAFVGHVSTNKEPVVVAVPVVTLAIPLSAVELAAFDTVGLDPAAAPAVMVGAVFCQYAALDE